VPLASALVLMGAIAAFLTAPAERPISTGEALRAVLRRWPSILLPVAVLGAGYALVAALSAGFAGSLDVSDPVTRLPRPEWLAFSIALALASPLILGVAVYLAVRWAVAVPAIVVEGLGLRAGLARSTTLTRRRMIRVLLALLAIVVIITILGWLLAAVPLVVAVVILIAGAGPLLVIPGILYVAGRILIAPLPAILVALLYGDFRSAEMHRIP
jgi:hypothetical protein